MFLHWRANLADQNKQQPLKINIRVTYHTVLSVWNKPLIDTCQHCSTNRANQAQVFKIEGFVWKRFFPYPPPPPLSFFGSCFISRVAKTENPVPRLSLLRNQTETLATQATANPPELTFWHWQRGQMSLAVFLPFFCSVSLTKKSRN